MSINKCNAEGYPDPTAHAALTSVMKEQRAKRIAPSPPPAFIGYRPLVYICSPLAGDVQANMERARAYCRFALTKNTIPIAPHLLFPQFMGEETEETRALALHMGLVLVCKCKELWFFGSRISPGMKGEIRKAKERGIIVRRFTEDCREVRHA